MAGFGIALTATCIAWVDRPASTWSHAHFHGVLFFHRLTHLVDPLLPLSCIGLAWLGVNALLRLPQPACAKTVLTFCLATVVTYTIKEELKLFFGRTWPETFTQNNPSWIGMQAYGFHIMHGGEGWTSFPSGHTADTTAPMTVLWYRVPRGRLLWVSWVALVVIGLYGSDYHFIGDMVAGALLAFGCATAILKLAE